MKHKDVKVGELYYAKIGRGARDRVKVLRTVPSYRGDRHQDEFTVRCADGSGNCSGREVQRSAAQLYVVQRDPVHRRSVQDDEPRHGGFAATETPADGDDPPERASGTS